MTMVMQDLNDKSYLLNVMDTPGKKERKKRQWTSVVLTWHHPLLGHTDYIDEVVAATRLADGVVLVVDVVEGVSVDHLVITSCQ